VVGTHRHAKTIPQHDIRESTICEFPSVVENCLYCETNKSVDSDREFDKAVHVSFIEVKKREFIREAKYITDLYIFF